MTSFAKHFRQYLIDENIITSSESSIDFRPAKKDCIVFYNTGGYGRDNTLDTLTSIEEPTIQILGVDQDPSKVFNKLQQIDDFILDKTNKVIGGYTYTLFSSQGGVLFISRDDDNRAKYVLNIRALRQKN